MSGFIGFAKDDSVTLILLLHCGLCFLREGFGEGKWRDGRIGGCTRCALSSLLSLAKAFAFPFLVILNELGEGRYDVIGGILEGAHWGWGGVAGWRGKSAGI